MAGVALVYLELYRCCHQEASKLPLVALFRPQDLENRCKQPLDGCLLTNSPFQTLNYLE